MSSTVHFTSSPQVPEVDAVVPKPKPIRKSRPKAPAYERHGPLVLGFAFSYRELGKRAFERLPEYRELSQQSPQPDYKMMYSKAGARILTHGAECILLGCLPTGTLTG
ncbi:hypothetical protein C8J55DRAFT_89717 [Lentinula edodes]|uniref:Uncharacterized protein n=1 Tax=Lentinula lateritia TaxID=40482 RepID=A0A9W9A9U6_9AGAR|nr:hypothetical protein C8J55DRAFT_89717 [Lentinula edodes]